MFGWIDLIVIIADGVGLRPKAGSMGMMSTVVSMLCCINSEVLIAVGGMVSTGVSMLGWIDSLVLLDDGVEWGLKAGSNGIMSTGVSIFMVPLAERVVVAQLITV